MAAAAVLSPAATSNIDRPHAPIHDPAHDPIMHKQNIPHDEPENSSVQVAVRIRPLSALEEDRRDFIQLIGSNNTHDDMYPSLGQSRTKSFSDNSTTTTHLQQSLYTTRSESTLESSLQKSESILSYQTVKIGQDEHLKQNFTFDHIFPLTTQQEDIYTKCVTPLVKSCLEGYNATVLAYGQTGSGKTHTILGDINNRSEINETEVFSPENSDLHVKKGEGVIPRALRHLFEGLEDQKLRAAEELASMEENEESPGRRRRNLSIPSTTNQIPFEYSVRIQFVELYGETIGDLLDKSHETGVGRGSLRRHRSTDHLMGHEPIKKVIRIRDGKEGEGAEMIGAENIEVHSVQDALDHLQRGMKKRVVGRTAMNAHSSRSHAIFSVVIHQTTRGQILGSGLAADGLEKENMMHVEMKTSKIHFVDLCGSESVKKAQTKGKRLKEGIDINKGLLILGNVISALGDGSKHHVPYRDSKLTRLLKGSLGGNHKTLMIACVSCSPSNSNETVNTLRYANRAKNIKNHAKINVDPQHRVVHQLRDQVAALASELLRVLDRNDNTENSPFSEEFLNDLVKGTNPQGWKKHDTLQQSYSNDSSTHLDISTHSEMRRTAKNRIGKRPSTSPDSSSQPQPQMRRQVSFNLRQGTSNDEIDTISAGDNNRDNNPADDTTSVEDAELTKNIKSYDYALAALRRSLGEKTSIQSFFEGDAEKDTFDVAHNNSGDGRRNVSLSPERRRQLSVSHSPPSALKKVRNIDELYNYLNENTRLNEEGEIVDEEGTVISEVVSSHVSKLDDAISLNEKLLKEMESCHEIFEVTRDENQDNLAIIESDLQNTRKEKEKLTNAQSLLQGGNSKGLIEALAVKDRTIKELSRERDDLNELNEKSTENLSHIQKLQESIDIMKKQRGDLSRISGRHHIRDPRVTPSPDNLNLIIPPPIPERKSRIRLTTRVDTEGHLRDDVINGENPENEISAQYVALGTVPPMLETPLDTSTHTNVSQLETLGVGSNHGRGLQVVPIYKKGPTATEIRDVIENKNSSEVLFPPPPRIQMNRRSKDFFQPNREYSATKIHLGRRSSKDDLNFSSSTLSTRRSAFDVIEDSISYKDKAHAYASTYVRGPYSVYYDTEIEEPNVFCGAGIFVDLFRGLFSARNPVLRQWDA